MNKKIAKILQEFFEKMGVEVEAKQKQEEEALKVNLKPADEKLVSLMIGYKGENLKALQHILRMIVRNQTEETIKLIIDINEYRASQENSIKEMVTSVAERVKRTGRLELLRPMAAYERRLVHIALKEIEGITTLSVGEDPNRRVMIKAENSER